MKYREGDVVLIRATLKNKHYLKASIYYHDIPIEELDIVGIESANFQVGDEVTDKIDWMPATIKAIDGEQAWLICGGKYRTSLLKDLERRESL